MSLTIVIIFIFAILITILNHKDRFLLFFGIQTFCAAVMLFSCFMIVAKLTGYRSTFNIDLALYMQIGKINISIGSIVTLYNVSNALFMCACVFQSKIFKKISSIKTIFLIIPAILTIVINHPHLRYVIFINFCDISSPLYFKSLYNFLYFITSITEVFYCLISVSALLKAYSAARIRVNKKRLFMLFLGLDGVILFVLCAFVFGPLSFMHSISIVYFPDSLPTWNAYIYLPVVLLIIFTAYMIITVKYNHIYAPFKASKYTPINDDTSIKMLFHNYKNSFFVIERLAKQIGKNPDFAERNAAMIEEIAQDGSTTIAKIIESFKSDFAFNPNKFSLIDCVKKAVKKSIIPENIEVYQSYNSENDIIHGNEAALCDAVVNIINNAADSVSSNIDDKKICISVFTEQALCCIEIKDNGKGIPKKDAKKIFSPFYSTKHGGKNNGIGLTYTKKIVSEHQGKIDFKSKPYEFTTFQVVFPVYKNKKKV